MSPEAPRRVRYYDGQLLTVADLVDEQGYHLAGRRRHAIGPHVWGIVDGLDLVASAEGVRVRGGYAVDGYGRELILAHDHAIAVTADDLARAGKDLLSVWLDYDRRPAGDGSDRWDETPQVRVAFDEPPPHRPSDPVPWDAPADDPHRRWPVYLGRAVLTETEGVALDVDARGRPLAGLRAGTIESPRRRVRLCLDDATDATAAGFEVRLDEGDPPPPGTGLRPPPVVRIDGDGGVAVRAPTRIDGDLHVGGGSVGFAAAMARAPAGADWRLYRVADPATGEDEIRLEIPVPAEGPDPAHAGFAIGTATEAPGGFRPAFSVHDDGTVRVHGDLVVEGRIDTSEQPPITRLSPEAEQTLRGARLAKETSDLATAAADAKKLSTKIKAFLKKIAPVAVPALAFAAGAVVENKAAIVQPVLDFIGKLF